MGLNSALKERDFRNIAMICLFWVFVTAILSFVPGVDEFILGAWVYIGITNILLVTGFVLGAKMSFSISDIPLIILSIVLLFILGTTGLPILISIYLYFYNKVRRNENVRSECKERAGKKTVI